MNGPRDFARMKTGLALALFGSVIGYVVPAYCQDPPSSGHANIAEATGPSWVPTGNLNAARATYTATLLSNGKVLVVGVRGRDPNITPAPALSDPGTVQSLVPLAIIQP